MPRSLFWEELGQVTETWWVTQVKMLFFYLNHFMIALLSVFKIWKSNKGKDWNLEIEGVACVTVGEGSILLLPLLIFSFLTRLGTRVLIVAWELLLVVKRTEQPGSSYPRSKLSPKFPLWRANLIKRQNTQLFYLVWNEAHPQKFPFPKISFRLLLVFEISALRIHFFSTQICKFQDNPYELLVSIFLWLHFSCLSDKIASSGPWRWLRENWKKGLSLSSHMENIY